jgi:hypothetical protein
MSGNFDNLNALRLSPEQVVAAQTHAAKPRKERKERTREAFYLVPESWLEGAAQAVRPSSDQLMIAVRLYRRWRLRKRGTDSIVASNVALGGPGFSREKKRRTIKNLAAASLLEVVGHPNGASPTLRILG